MKVLARFDEGLVKISPKDHADGPKRPWGVTYFTAAQEDWRR